MCSDLLTTTFRGSWEYHLHDCFRIIKEYTPAIYSGGAKAASGLWFRVPQWED